MSGGARRILINSLHRSVADVGSKVLSFVFYVVLAREVGRADFGLFVFALSLVSLTSSLPDLGQDKVLTREVAPARERIHRYFANTLALKTGLAVPALGLAVAIAAASGIRGDGLTVVALLGAAITLELLTATCFATFQSYERMGFVPVVLISQRLVTALAGTGALLLGAGVVTVSALYLAGALVGLALALTLLARRVVRPRAAIEVADWMPLLRAALPIGLAGVLSLVLFRVDTVLLGIYEPESVVGEYGAAYRLFEATLLVSWGVGAAVYPVLSRLERGARLALVFERALKLVTALTLPLACGTLVLAEPAMRAIYGPGYEGGAGALRLLAPAIVLYGPAYLGGYLLITQRRQGVVTLVYGVVLAATVLACVVLIPWLSLEGAALATTASQALVAAALLRAALAVTGPLDWLRVLAGPALAAALATGAMALLAPLPTLAVAGGGLIYAAALLAFERAVFPDDAGALAALAARGDRSAA